MLFIDSIGRAISIEASKSSLIDENVAFRASTRRRLQNEQSESGLKGIFDIHALALMSRSPRIGKENLLLLQVVADHHPHVTT